MFATIFRFEIQYWLQKPSIYVYAGIFLLLAIGSMAAVGGLFDNESATEEVVRLINSPIALMDMIGSLERALGQKAKMNFLKSKVGFNNPDKFLQKQRKFDL